MNATDTEDRVPALRSGANIERRRCAAALTLGCRRCAASAGAARQHMIYE
jgi:hypothetical protein